MLVFTDSILATLLFVSFLFSCVSLEGVPSLFINEVRNSMFERDSVGNLALILVVS